MFICTHDIWQVELPLGQDPICDVIPGGIVTCRILLYVRQVVCLPPFNMTKPDILSLRNSLCVSLWPRARTPKVSLEDALAGKNPVHALGQIFQLRGILGL